MLQHRSILMQEIQILQPIASSTSHFEHVVRYYQAWQDNGTTPSLLGPLC